MSHTDESYYVWQERFPGVAFHFLRLETERRVIEPDWSEVLDDFGNPMDADVWYPDEGDFEEVLTGMWVMSMVGDDYEWVIDPDDVSEYDHPVCSCGQVGCGWHGEGGV